MDKGLETAPGSGVEGAADHRVRGTHRARALAFSIGIIGAAAATSDSRAELVAAWNFNDTKPVHTIEADLGVGLLDLYGVGGEADLFSGTDLNAVDGWRAGDALGLRGNVPGGGLLVTATASRTLGADSALVTVSFATRRSSTGFGWFQVEQWTGSAWDVVDTVEVGTDWSASSVSFERSAWPPEVELRLTPLEAAAGTGTFRLDNLQVEIAAVPAPGAMGLAMIAMGSGRRRRRRTGVERVGRAWHAASTTPPVG